MRNKADLNLNIAVQNHILFHVVVEQFLASEEFMKKFLCPVQSQLSTTEKCIKKSRIHLRKSFCMHHSWEWGGWITQKLHLCS